MKITLTDGRVVEGTFDEIRQLLGLTAPTPSRRRPRRVIPPHNCDDTSHCVRLFQIGGKRVTRIDPRDMPTP